MQRHPVITKDGSHTLSVPGMNVTYHSIHGAIQESRHVFIEAGWKQVATAIPGNIQVLEMGFGTGLNALLTLQEAEYFKKQVFYQSLDLFPLSPDEATTLNYCEKLNFQGCSDLFSRLHACSWEKDEFISEYFTLHKSGISLLEFKSEKKFNLFYFDAFAPAAQPELWTQPVFESLAGMAAPGAILVTYCSKGEVRRALLAGGWQVEKIPGPPGKREMVRAVKSR